MLTMMLYEDILFMEILGRYMIVYMMLLVADADSYKYINVVILMLISKFVFGIVNSSVAILTIL